MRGFRQVKSVHAGLLIVLSTPGLALAAEPSVAVKPAACLSDVRLFTADMKKDGYWFGGSDYGYGYPIGMYGYGGGGYPLGGYPVGSATGYFNQRPGYEVRNLLSSANILARNGQQEACEDVLKATRSIYKTYVAGLTERGIKPVEGPGWREEQIATALPVTDATATGSAQLLDVEVRNLHDVSLGSVHDLVGSPATGKLIYLIVARGGLFGIDQTYVPVPWTAFKTNPAGSLLVLDTTKVAMSAAPEMTDAKFERGGQFDQLSAKVDDYWKKALPAAIN